MTSSWVVPGLNNDWSLVRTRGGRTVHVKCCPRATNGTPWKWATGRTFEDVFLTAPNVEWASCCCGFAHYEAGLIREKLSADAKGTE